MSNNKEIMVKNKQNLRKLESMYVNSQIDNLDELIAVRKEELTNKLAEYETKCTKIKHNKNGEPYYELEVNPYVIQRYFFQSINPIQSREPNYSPEKLSIVWELYQDILCEVNTNIGDYTPSLTSFCTFAGITLNTFRNWKSSNDLDMRTIVEKINDACFDLNVTLAQKGKLKERSTIYRMKSEQEVAEKEQPQIHFHEHNENKIDIEKLNQKLEEIQGYHRTKNKVIEVSNIGE